MVKIRDLRPSDFEQIQKLAKLFPWFTIPSKYMIWMLATTQKPYCKVLTVEKKIFAYILTINTSNKDELFLWQLGVEKIQNSSDLKLLTNLCDSFYNECMKSGISGVRFTVPQNGPEKLIFKITNSLKNKNLQIVQKDSKIPQTDYPKIEREFIIKQVG
ncbi:MAG: hypothetical protein COZ25_05005 [Ignavibacteria bacterium CG_4_10_14_3_um_filter_37_18]|nr:MAG: hypothetical protein COZ25_05005 [Ignavibacteria bacterium CG_4_10_14_3_um_filter_37_18]PJC58223.1 MAG: hypothetical protein CO025_09825 [Ignavibacteria bacterium CG_4_9_14_0_2_um_filter_37_13]